MSIVALKRKTQAQYNNMSVGQSNFSLNGTHRNQGFVGQTSLSRSLPRTLMKGITPRGHGGCCGFYPRTRIVQSAVNSTEDSNVIKSSSINTNALFIQKRYMLRNSNNSLGTVKPDSIQNNNTSEYHTTRLANTVLNAISKNPICQNDSTRRLSIKFCNKSNPLFKTAYTRTNYLGECNIVKSVYLNNKCNINPSKPRPVLEYGSQDNYITIRKRACINSDVVTVPTNNRREPFAGF